MRKEYLQELEDLKSRMEEAEKFAEKLPIFADKILENKYSENSKTIHFGERYKDTPLKWGITRRLYNHTQENEHILNYRGEDFTGYLYEIYINSVSLFDSYNDFGLEEDMKDVPIFFHDKLNSRFFLTDEQITYFLETLNIWYLKARAENKVFIAKKKVEDAKKALEDAEKELA